MHDWHVGQLVVRAPRLLARIMECYFDVTVGFGDGSECTLHHADARELTCIDGAAVRDMYDENASPFAPFTRVTGAARTWTGERCEWHRGSWKLVKSHAKSESEARSGASASAKAKARKRGERGVVLRVRPCEVVIRPVYVGTDPVTGQPPPVWDTHDRSCHPSELVLLEQVSLHEEL